VAQSQSEDGYAYHKKLKILDPKEQNRQQGLKLRIQNKKAVKGAEAQEIQQDVLEVQVQKKKTDLKEVELISPVQMFDGVRSENVEIYNDI
jgi:hypothetical protein